MFDTSEAGVRGHVRVCVLTYRLVRIIEDRLDAAGIDVSATEALQDLARIQHAALYSAGVTEAMTSALNEHHKRILATIDAPIP